MTHLFNISGSYETKQVSEVNANFEDIFGTFLVCSSSGGMQVSFLFILPITVIFHLSRIWHFGKISTHLSQSRLTVVNLSRALVSVRVCLLSKLITLEIPLKFSKKIVGRNILLPFSAIHKLFVDLL